MVEARESSLSSNFSKTSKERSTLSGEVKGPRPIHRTTLAMEPPWTRRAFVSHPRPCLNVFGCAVGKRPPASSESRMASVRNDRYLQRLSDLRGIELGEDIFAGNFVGQQFVEKSGPRMAHA